MELKVFDDFSKIPDSDLIKDRVPVFALPIYTSWINIEKGYSTIWFLGERNENQLMIPFAVLKRGPFKKGMFLTSVILIKGDHSISDEQIFLDNIIIKIKKKNLCDWVQQPPNWAIFNACPTGAIYVKYGTYFIDLKGQPEEQLFSNISNWTRTNIKKATAKKILLKYDSDILPDLYTLIKRTAIIGGISYPSYEMFQKMHEILNGYILSCVAYYNGEPQTGVTYLYSSYGIYGLYAGSIAKPMTGSTAYLHWHTAIKNAKQKNIDRFDLVGAIIDPEPGTKDYQIQQFKESLGATLQKGFIWKYVISREKYLIYRSYIKLIFLMRKRRGELDIIDKVLQNSLK